MKRSTKLLIVFLLVFLNSENILAQEDNKSEAFKHFSVSVTLGHVYIPQANSGDLKTLIVPSVGFGFQYWLNPKWGIALKSDLEIASYTVKKGDLMKLKSSEKIL